MRKTWEEPRISVQEFVANEYVAACGDSGTVYKFKCDAGNRQSAYNVFFNGNDGIAGTADDIAWTTSERYNPIHKRGSYRPCGTTHEASTSDEFYKGYMYEQSSWSGKNTGEMIEVIVWTNNGTNTHCTINLNQSSWETSKS